MHQFLRQKRCVNATNCGTFNGINLHWFEFDFLMASIYRAHSLCMKNLTKSLHLFNRAWKMKQSNSSSCRPLAPNGTKMIWTKRYSIIGMFQIWQQRSSSLCIAINLCDSMINSNRENSIAGWCQIRFLHLFLVKMRIRTVATIWKKICWC